MIYFDGVHMMGTDLWELDETAMFIGLKLEYRQEKHGRIHYDVFGAPFHRLLKVSSVKFCSTREMLNALRKRG